MIIVTFPFLSEVLKKFVYIIRLNCGMRNIFAQIDSGSSNFGHAQINLKCEYGPEVHMMKDALMRYNRAAELLPEYLRPEIKLPQRMCLQAEEIRLRAGKCASVLLSEGEFITGTRPVTQEDLNRVVEIATGASVYSVRDTVKAGYITAKGGYRIGLCGSAVVVNGETDGFRELSSLSVRIPGEVKGVACGVMSQIVKEGRFGSALIISPPGGGKTTLLRDCVRMLSDGDAELGLKGMRVALADERGEIACLHRGVPQRDVGIHTDIAEGIPKAQAVMLLLRAMNPQIIAMDEITAPEDISAIQSCANCGVKLIATAHAESVDDLKSRKMYLSLLDSGIFENIVFITKHGSKRSFRVEKLGR